MSIFVTDTDCVFGSISVLNKNVSSIQELNVAIEEADARLIPYIYNESENGAKQFLQMTLMWLCCLFISFQNVCEGLREL